jgi:hypothetical protein
MVVNGEPSILVGSMSGRSTAPHDAEAADSLALGRCAAIVQEQPGSDPRPRPGSTDTTATDTAAPVSRSRIPLPRRRPRVRQGTPFRVICSSALPTRRFTVEPPSFLHGVVWWPALVSSRSDCSDEVEHGADQETDQAARLASWFGRWRRRGAVRRHVGWCRRQLRRRRRNLRWRRWGRLAWCRRARVRRCRGHLRCARRWDRAVDGAPTAGGAPDGLAGGLRRRGRRARRSDGRSRGWRQ